MIGIKHFKAGETVEAFQCLNMALKMDPDNVEGLVARGALYANGGSLDKVSRLRVCAHGKYVPTTRTRAR